VDGTSDDLSITIPEGWNTMDISHYLDAKGMDGAAFITLTAAHDDDTLRQHFAILEDEPHMRGLEGYLFPDTYRVLKSAPIKDFVIKMIENLDKKFTPKLRAESRVQNKTIFEIITMASLIENEVRTDADRALVSGILWKRIAIGMPLQVDATIAYIKDMRDASPTTNGKISREDTTIDSPYNTYQYRGLPAGPISNPGLASLEAAANPSNTNYLYYISDKSEINHYAETLEQHNDNINKYGL
jgi:UPF0755 protein